MLSLVSSLPHTGGSAVQVSELDFRKNTSSRRWYICVDSGTKQLSLAANSSQPIVCSKEALPTASSESGRSSLFEMTPIRFHSQQSLFRLASSGVSLRFVTHLRVQQGVLFWVHS